MRSILKIIGDNARWIFSGIGGVALILIVTFYDRDSEPTAINRSNNAGSSDDDQIEYLPSLIDSLQPEDIIEAITSVPLLQRKNVINHYFGIKVRWQCTIVDLSKLSENSHRLLDTNLVRALLITKGRYWINCYLESEKHPGLSLVREGDTVIVEGVISGYEYNRIELAEARLFY